MDTRSLSIIIPTYNEEAIIAESLKALLSITERYEGIEIIVSDASTDGTRKILSDFPVTVCHSAKGRAIQMNTGARSAKGDILYFLHADTLVPETFIDNIRSAIGNGKKAGCFRMNFNDSDPIMSLYGWFTQFPLMICRGGDQSLFIEKSLFQEIGGFDETHLVMEDINIINRIEKLAEFHILEAEVTTSARRYHQNGIIRLQLLFGAIHLMYALGCDQETIVRYYRENISEE
jgi:rSAM/selenodomain-associated transferase 2